MGTFDSSDELLFKIHKGFAIITFNIPHKKNAMTAALYTQLASLLRTIDQNDAVFATILTGNGDYFSAGADVKQNRGAEAEESLRTAMLKRLSASNMDLAHAMYRHSKILIAALNGPAIGLSAAILEGGASLSFPRRMGISMANEALILGKKLSAPALQSNGFFNKLFPHQDAASFISSVLAYLEDKFSGIDTEAAIRTKALIKATLPDPDPSNIREVFQGSQQLASGKPQEAFSRLANKQMRHKL